MDADRWRQADETIRRPLGGRPLGGWGDPPFSLLPSTRRSRPAGPMNAGQDAESQYLTVVEVARILRFSTKTIERWAREGRLPYVVICGERRFRRDDVDAIVEGLIDPPDL